MFSWANVRKKSGIDSHRGRTTTQKLTCEIAIIAIRKIKKQRVITENVGESGLAEISEAVNCAEEAMFYLATAAAEDDEAVRRILTDYGLEDLYPDAPANLD